MKELLEKNLPELLRFATAKTGNRQDAEDLVHGAIEKILINYPNISNNTEFLKLSYRIIRNLFIDIKRKKKREFLREDLGNISNSNTLEGNGEQDSTIEDYIEYNARDIDEEIRFKSMDAEEKIVEKEIKISKYKKFEIAQFCLSALENETQKDVLTLHSQRLKYDEIAKRLDIPIGTVMSSLARARIKVAECIKKRLKNE